MKIRNGFVSNSSSSSFVIHMTKEMSNKFNKTFIKNTTYPKMTYESLYIITNEQKLLQYFKTRFFDNLLVKKFKLCEVSHELEFEPLNEKEFYKNMTENISYYEEKIDEYKEDLYNCSIEKVSNEEERKNQEEDINIYKKSIERYEQLILRDKHIRDKGPIEYLKSGECKKVQNEFHSMLKLLKTQDIWNINFRRDGEAPESDFEDYLAKLSETEFVDHMKKQYKINIKKIEKENM